MVNYLTVTIVLYLHQPYDYSYFFQVYQILKLVQLLFHSIVILVASVAVAEDVAPQSNFLFPPIQYFSNKKKFWDPFSLLKKDLKLFYAYVARYRQIQQSECLKRFTVTIISKLVLNFFKKITSTKFFRKSVYREILVAHNYYNIDYQYCIEFLLPYVVYDSKLTKPKLNCLSFFRNGAIDYTLFYLLSIFKSK